MKKIVAVLFCLLLYLPSFSQLSAFDSSKAKLQQNLNDSVRFLILIGLSESYNDLDPDSAVHYAQLAAQFEKEKKNSLPRWADWNVNSVMGLALWSTGNYPDAKENFLTQYKKCEEINDPFGIYKANLNLGILEFMEEDYKEATKYLSNAYKIFQQQRKYSPELWETGYYNLFNHLALGYAAIDSTTLAINYANEGIQIGTKYLGVDAVGVAGIPLGFCYSRMGQSKLAFEYFRTAQSVIDKYRPNSSLQHVELYYAMARFFDDNKQTDSAIYYAKKAYKISKEKLFKTNILSASVFLSKLYESKNNLDSAFTYLNIGVKTREELFSKEKASRIQVLEFNERLRQHERQIEENKAKTKRKHNLQLFILSIAILVVILIFLRMSISAINHRYVYFLSILILLIVFEFINLLVHPFLEKITHDSPILILLGLVVIGAILIPLHHKIEHWVTTKFVAINKAFRLKKAKETIKELEK